MHLSALVLLVGISCVMCVPLADPSKTERLEANEVADSTDTVVIPSPTITHTISTVYTKDEDRQRFYKEILDVCNNTTDDSSDCPGCKFAEDVFADPQVKDTGEPNTVTLVSAMKGVCHSDEERDASLQLLLASLISGGLGATVMDGVKQATILVTSINTEDYRTSTLFTYSVTAELNEN